MRGEDRSMVTEKKVLQQLKALGTAQNRKVYARHGAGENLYGVSYANLGKLHKQIKVDHGETGCKTPDAARYIRKAVEHKRTKAKAKRRR